MMPVSSLLPWPNVTHPTFGFGELVQKRSGSEWRGRVVGWYSTDLTPEGYAVESDMHAGSVQIYPASALRRC
jgi:dihydrofolate reductase (trimethoprim resistance protein)